MCDSNEVKWLDAGSLPVDTPSNPGHASSELEEAPEILITNLNDLKKLRRIFHPASRGPAGTNNDQDAIWKPGSEKARKP